MNNSFGYLPPEQRKKILLITDDIRVHSGVATVAREIVLKTCQHFNWVNIGGSIRHPEAGKRLDISADTNKNAGIEDASVIIYPAHDYGGPDMLKQVIQLENPDAKPVTETIQEPVNAEFVTNLNNGAVKVNTEVLEENPPCWVTTKTPL